jgi:hypothetical protein
MPASIVRLAASPHIGTVATEPIALLLAREALGRNIGPAGNIDSRSGVNTQQRFKRIDVPIRLFQISISQSPLGDFCNTIPFKAEIRWLG